MNCLLAKTNQTRLWTYVRQCYVILYYSKIFDLNLRVGLTFLPCIHVQRKEQIGEKFSDS